MCLANRQVEKLSRALLELHSQKDFHSLPQVLIRIVKELLPAEISTYNEIDRGSGQLRVVDDFPGNPRKYLPAFMAHVNTHPLVRHVFETGDTRALKNSDFVSQQDFERTAIYNEFYRHFGIRFQLAAFLPRSARFDVALGLQRCEKDFTEEERTMLDLFAPHFALAWRNARELAQGTQQPSPDGADLSRRRQMRVELNGSWHVRALDRETQHILKRYFRLELKEGRRAPVFLREWLRRKTSLNVETVLDPRTNVSVSSTSDGETATLSWVPESPLKSWLVITIRTPIRTVIDRKTNGLTAREKEVLCWVMEGKNNPEIGAILKTSPNTVRKHLERIYAKLEVENRAAAMRVIWEGH